MKICVLTTSYPLHAGHLAGTFVHAGAAELARLGHEIRVVAPGHDGSDPLEKRDGVEIRRFTYFPIRRLQRVAYGGGIVPNLRRSWMARLQLPLFMLAFRQSALRHAAGADVIHAHWSASGLPGISCRKRYGMPLVLSVRGSDLSGAGGRFITARTRKIVAQADILLTVSDSLREQARGMGVPAERAVTVRNGVDLEAFRPARSRAVLEGTAAADAGKVLLFVGRLSRVKGPDIALDAFEELCREDQKSHLVVVGDGEMKESLSSRVEGSALLRHRVLFAGEVSTGEMPGYYHASDLLLISSRSEGTPNALYEAMACGLPAVSVPVGGVPEVLADGVTGALAAGQSPGQLASRVAQVLSSPDLLAAMSSHCRRWAKEHLSWERAAEEYLRVYRQAMHRKSSDPPRGETQA